MTGDGRGRLLDHVVRTQPPAFALLRRSGPAGPDTVDVLVGDVHTLESLAAVPLPDPTAGPGPTVDTLVVLPYRQLRERGFAAPDDGAPLLAMVVTAHDRISTAEAATRIPDLSTSLLNQHFDVADEDYAELVKKIISAEIGAGEGANFVLKRRFVADIADYSPGRALGLFRRLLAHEQGAYWTFVIHLGDRTLVGATPERHVTLGGRRATMNPISGTYRYPPGGPTLRGVTRFLADRKEADELYMVVDEELKMMAQICPSGCRLVGPRLREMARLAHTEYLIEGDTDRDVREILRATMFAPTVTGSPVESAARVINRYEPQGRGYYSGVAALIGRDEHGERWLDSAILIRTAEIDARGRLGIGVGATLVRHSDPDTEVAETRAKAAGLLSAAQATTERPLSAHPTVREALRRRNTGIADFWLRPCDTDRRVVPELAGRSALIVDAEDTFTAMIALQLRSLGLSVTVRRFDESFDPAAHDLVVMGPGPGDPRAEHDPRIARIGALLRRLLAAGQPLVAVCLSHQILSLSLGLKLVRREVPNQGTQQEIDLFGSPERVGFYNTFAAHSADDQRTVPGVGPVEVCRDRDTGEVHALRGPRFVSMQFHAESVLTVDGERILASAIRRVLPG
ncbi:MAG TPA: anthranilate synthase family protein [Rugosimonospora sp.]|nr:anthranilate synthase family protein [Rugosimonospora sp.]